MQRRNVTAYIGLPQGKIGVSVCNEKNACGVPVITIANVEEKSVVGHILSTGDIVTQLNGKDVPSDDTSFQDDAELAVDEFVDLLHAAGQEGAGIRYLLFTRDLSKSSDPIMAMPSVDGQGKKDVGGKSIDVRASTSEKVGITVELDKGDDGDDEENMLGAAMNKISDMVVSMSPSRRKNLPLRISSIAESSQIEGQVRVGDRITHVNGHLLIGIKPAEFAKILKDIMRSEDEEKRLVLTIRRVQDE